MNDVNSHRDVCMVWFVTDLRHFDKDNRDWMGNALTHLLIVLHELILTMQIFQFRKAIILIAVSALFLHIYITYTALCRYRKIEELRIQLCRAIEWISNNFEAHKFLLCLLLKACWVSSNSELCLLSNVVNEISSNES